MNNIKTFSKRLLGLLVVILAFCIFRYSASAASTPALTLINNASTIGINVTSADSNATVNLYFPNTSIVANPATGVTYTSIDIGRTNSNGSFSISVASNSYGLSGGSSVYVSVDGANSSQMTWPTTSTNSGQSGSLSLSQQNVTLVNGQIVTIFPMNTSNTLTVQGNSNSSVASAYFQSSNDSVVITGLNTGSTNISICAGSAGCGSVAVTVQAPTQSITFSQTQAYVVVGQASQTVSLYGGSGYSLSNTNKDIVSAIIDGSNIVLQGLTTGQVAITVCATGLLCGNITVNSLASGSAVPNQVTLPPSANSNFSQKPQLTSFSMTSNNVLNLFFGANSTLTITFGVNQTVSNVQAKIAGQQASIGQGNSGTYSASYRLTGNETLPLPVIISYTNPSGLIGQNYFWFGDSATLPTSSTVSTPSSSCPTGLTCTLSSNVAVFTYLLSIGSTGSEVKALQQQLKDDGVYSGPITGTFGSLTEVAVKKYQAKHGLKQVGVVGPGTRALLNKEI